MYGRSNQYNSYKGSASYDQYASNTGYDAQYGGQYDNSYGNQYTDSQYGSSSGYGTGSYGHQSRAVSRTNTSPQSHLSPSISPKRGYGSPVPRRSNSPGMQIPVPTLQTPDSMKRMDRYRSCSPGRRNAMLGLDGQNMAASNTMNNNAYGGYNTCSSLSPVRRVNPLSGVESTPGLRPSDVRRSSLQGNVPVIQLDGQMHPTSGMGMMRKNSYGAGTPVSPNLIQFFNNVDTDMSGKISWNELQRALLNGDWSEFDERTCRLMISMFDNSWSGTINVQEFSSLWKYINEWQNIFDGFDNDASGTIDSRELYQAFLTFGYTLPTHFSQTVVSMYDKTGKGSLKFDGFINACVLLKLVTRRFEEKDINNSKRIQLNMEQFMEIVLDTCLVNI